MVFITVRKFYDVQKDMKGFTRDNPYFSLCGLNCKLCSMNLAGHCGGCVYERADPEKKDPRPSSERLQ